MDIEKSKKTIKKYKQLSGTFSSIWIITWFLACWVFHYQLFFTGLFSFFLAVICYGVVSDEKKEIEGYDSFGNMSLMIDNELITDINKEKVLETINERVDEKLLFNGDFIQLKIILDD